jgi:hypothetical protein
MSETEDLELFQDDFEEDLRRQVTVRFADGAAIQDAADEGDPLALAWIENERMEYDMMLQRLERQFTSPEETITYWQSLCSTRVGSAFYGPDGSAYARKLSNQMLALGLPPERVLAVLPYPDEAL